MKKSLGALEARISSAVTLHLEDFQAKEMIDIVEKRITDTMNRIQKLEEPKQKAFDEYEKLQNEYDTINARLIADRKLVDTLSKFKNDIKKGVDIRIVRGESHNDMKPREKKKYAKRKGVMQFSWMDYGVGTLKEYGKFMTLEDLWEMAVVKYSIDEKAKELGHMLSKLKWGAIHNCWLANCKYTRKGGIRGVMIDYNGLIGLKEWATEDFRPKFEYMKGVIVPKLQAAS